MFQRFTAVCPPPPSELTASYATEYKHHITRLRIFKIVYLKIDNSFAYSKNIVDQIGGSLAYVFIFMKSSDMITDESVHVYLSHTESY